MSKSICSVEGCAREVHVKSRGLCRADYALFIRTGSTGIQVTRRRSELDTESHKACVVCGGVKSRTEFYRSSRAKDGYRGECKPCMKAKNKASYYKNHERNLARSREFEATPERKAYVTKYLESYLPANRAAYAERSAERRARLREATVDAGITVSALRERHGDSCMYCGVTMLFGNEARVKHDRLLASLEHVMPLSRGGAHSWENVRLACLGCNVIKNNKTPDEWLNYSQGVGLTFVSS